VVVEPNYVELTRVDKVSFASLDGLSRLRDLYSDALTQRMEGLIIKKASSPYLPGNRSEWLKLKKDYIEGFGDTAEFAVVGVAHNLEANGLLAKLIIGVLTNKAEMLEDYNQKPKFLLVSLFIKD